MSSTEMRVRSGVSSITRATEDDHVLDARGTRDGALYTADWLISKALEGRVMVASAGTLTGPLTWTATATIDLTKAAVMIAVPLGTTIIPVSISLYMEAFGSNAQFECCAVTGTGGVSAGGTAVTVTNARTDAPYTSLCTVTSDLTGATAPTTNVCEFWRDGEQFAITKTAASATVTAGDVHKYEWKLSDGLVAPVIVGAGQLVIAQGSQAGTGFCKIVWVEEPSTAIL